MAVTQLRYLDDKHNDDDDRIGGIGMKVDPLGIWFVWAKFEEVRKLNSVMD